MIRASPQRLPVAPAPQPPPAEAPQADDWLPVGQVVGVQGLRGELRVNPASDFPERFTVPGTRWLRGRNGAVKGIELMAGRQLPGKSLFVVRFEGINDRTAAEALVGQTLLVRADDRPDLADGEFHLLDLVGLEVRVNADGETGSAAVGSGAVGSEVIGTVTDLISGGNDLLEVELRDGGRRVLIPFVETIVPEVHLEEGWLLLTPPPGLLEL
ncbi:ribosome maturation factor RimM [Synechococcus sp. BS56D]|uniref:ribosome maturation factor RimM n=1 Tax=Synechococcus sp. BS56D TaxID=2055944 RepID=UPI0010395A03|nr:ribosome maturation factor RimM [Synechococcus sp. BS56D]TCD57741.1 ribosome maturation factor RimM [Synechococcus sp. BS56D]